MVRDMCSDNVCRNKHTYIYIHLICINLILIHIEFPISSDLYCEGLALNSTDQILQNKGIYIYITLGFQVTCALKWINQNHIHHCISDHGKGPRPLVCCK